MRRNQRGHPHKHLSTGQQAPKKKSKVSFDEHYREVYRERWPSLRSAMCAPSAKVAMWNRFSLLSCDEAADGLELLPSAAGLQLFAGESATGTREDIAQPPRDATGTPAYYLLDFASTVIVEQLLVESHHHVLDLCAAPGGKSIAIAQLLSPQGKLISNEASADRAARLRRNLDEYLGSSKNACCEWQVTQRDATTWHSPEAFDRVLVDAPCSSERHLLQQSGGIREWSPQTTAELAQVQTQLLLRAFEAVKVGGRVVYSTCSISPVENDDVVRDCLAKSRCEMHVEKSNMRIGSASKFGCIMLPDECNGWGPMFCAAFVKRASLKNADTSSEEDTDENGDG